MYKISVDKELFKDIQFKKIQKIEKETSKYWKKELLEPRIENDRIKYTIKQIDKLMITNGLGDDKPQLTIECEKVDYSFKKDIFEFYLGKILEQKNTDIEENYKDNLIEELLREKAELEDSMNRDHITKIYNRRKMENDLNMFINQNNSSSLSTIFISIDRFKRINNNYGYDMGDKILMLVAQKLENYAKLLKGQVYRYESKEFAILCFSSKDEIVSRLDNLKSEINEMKIYHTKRDIKVTSSFGVSFFNKSFSKETMLKQGREKLNLAKNNGRNRVEI